jgi:8-oxo-dGTP pyrophosphatase MutT (NUDIX family)
MDTNNYRRPDKIIVYLYRRPEPDQIEYLLLQRAPTGRAGPIWQTVVGNAQWGEQLIEAARREVFEETGLTRLQGIIAIGYAFSFDFIPPHQSDYAPDVKAICNTVFASEVVSARPVMLSAEHIGHGWFPYPEALTRIHWIEEKEALIRLHPMLSGAGPQG